MPLLRESKVFLVGETQIDTFAMQEYLEHVGAPEWRPHGAKSDSEILSEFMGRLCYRSWKPGLNPNVTKVREGNAEYLANVLNQRHGSVFEHAVLNFVFADVSRVFTHEIVRHRAGVAISQESLRYVRLTDIPFWIPPEIEANPEAKEIFLKAVSDAEDAQRRLTALFDLDNAQTFHEKKSITSAMRRIAPDGLLTTIGWSCNLRALRHVLEQRTATGAEVEIRRVFAQVGALVLRRYPNAFSDFVVETPADGIPMYRPKNPKV